MTKQKGKQEENLPLDIRFRPMPLTKGRVASMTFPSLSKVNCWERQSGWLLTDETVTGCTVLSVYLIKLAGAHK